MLNAHVFWVQFLVINNKVLSDKFIQEQPIRMEFFTDMLQASYDSRGPFDVFGQ